MNDRPITSTDLIERTGGAAEPFEFTPAEREQWHAIAARPTTPPPHEFVDGRSAVEKLVGQLAALDPIERYDVIDQAQRQALELEKAAQHDKSPMSIKDALELEQAMAAGMKAGHCRVIGIDYTAWSGRVRGVRVWDLIDSAWYGMEFRDRRRMRLPTIHPWRFDVRAEMVARGWKVFVGNAPDSPAWGVGFQLTTADHALHELGRFGWGVCRYKAFLRALERGNDIKAPRRRRRDLLWCLAILAGLAAIWWWL